MSEEGKTMEPVLKSVPLVTTLEVLSLSRRIVNQIRFDNSIWHLDFAKFEILGWIAQGALEKGFCKMFLLRDKQTKELLLINASHFQITGAPQIFIV